MFEEILRGMISSFKARFPYNIGNNNNRILQRLRPSNETFSSFHARKMSQEKIQMILHYWKFLTTTLERLHLYGTVNYESRIVKIYEKSPGNPFFARAGDFLDAVIYGFTIDDALILLAIDDIYSDTVKLKVSYLELALWLESLQQQRRQFHQHLA